MGHDEAIEHTDLANLANCIRGIKEQIRKGKRIVSDPVMIQLTDYKAKLTITFKGEVL